MQYIFEEWAYLTWAIGAAVLFYSVTSFATSHMHPAKRAALALWLKGNYESTWSVQFCRLFDRLFGEKHFGLRCIFRSAIASLLAVIALWLLFDQVLGLISLRADSGLTLFQALLLGASINLLPDYLSLYQTRWLLQKFESVRHPLGQVGLLIADLGATGFIFFVVVKLYLWITGQSQIAFIEIVAVFSVYAVFFYSTFLTSFWAWAYCASSWLARLSTRLQNWLNVAEAPGRTLALLGALFVFLVCLMLKPALDIDDNGRTPLDNALCNWFPASVCKHLVRTTEDDKEKLALLLKACDGGATKQCLDSAKRIYNIEPKQAERLLKQSCAGDEFAGCTYLGMMYQYGDGVTQDYSLALHFYEQGCRGGHMGACTSLGAMYDFGYDVDEDNSKAIELYRLGCNGNHANGCANLGAMYYMGEGVKKDLKRAFDLYQQGCDGGSSYGCTNLGYMYRQGEGVLQDYGLALQKYQKGCDLGYSPGCGSVAYMVEHGLGTETDQILVERFYSKGCDMGHFWSCDQLDRLRENVP